MSWLVSKSVEGLVPFELADLVKGRLGTVELADFVKGRLGTVELADFINSR